MGAYNRIEAAGKVKIGMLVHAGLSKKLPLFFDPHLMRFLTVVSGAEVYGESVPQLCEAVTAHQRKRAVKLSIPFCYLWGGKIVRGTVTGVHAKHGRPLVKWTDGNARVRSLDRSDRDVMRPMTPSEEGHFLKLARERDRAEEAFERYRRKFEFDLGDEISRQLDAAQQAARTDEALRNF